MDKKDIENLLSVLLKDKVWITIECTVQARQYEPVKIVMGQSQTIGPSDNPNEIRMQICQKILQDAIQEGNKIKGISEPPTEETTDFSGRRRRNI